MKTPLLLLCALAALPACGTGITGGTGEANGSRHPHLAFPPQLLEPSVPMGTPGAAASPRVARSATGRHTDDGVCSPGEAPAEHPAPSAAAGAA